MMEIKNKKAYFNYYIDEEYESGMVLTGTEIKSVRNGSINIKDSYIRIKNQEMYIINMYVAKYENGSIFNHDEYRERKLLLHKKEINKISQKVNEDGYTLIPLKVYFVKNKAKVLIGLCRGKKLYDKRASLKEKDIQKQTRGYYEKN